MKIYQKMKIFLKSIDKKLIIQNQCINILIIIF